MTRHMHGFAGAAVQSTSRLLSGVAAVLVAWSLAQMCLSATAQEVRSVLDPASPEVLSSESQAPIPPEPNAWQPAEQLPEQTVASGLTPTLSQSIPNVAAVCPRCGVSCCGCNTCVDRTWDFSGPIPWEVFAQGEYVGPPRLPHVAEYRIRTDDQLEFIFRLTAESSSQRYRLQAGDQLRVDCLSAEEYSRDGVVVEPDGYISLAFGQIRAGGLTLEQLRSALETRLGEEGVQDPRVAVAPAFVAGSPTINTRLEELRNTVDARQAVTGGQATRARVTPEGTVQLPAIGSVPATGLTLSELKREIEFRYAQIVDGVEVTPVLADRAPRHVYVLGEVRNPGRYTLEGPTTLMQAITLAGGWNVGAQLKGIVVFRRDDNWQLMATKLNMYKPLFGKRPCPADEIWIRDSDIVLVPQSSMLAADNFIELMFTRGIYGVMPFSTGFAWSSFVLRNTGFVPVP